MPQAISYVMNNNELVIQSGNLKMDVVTVFNLLGQKIIEIAINEYAATINMDNLFNGIYLVVLNGERGRDVMKISIQ
ncbi:MAG: T9SS type A sorting domain-containing protein [Chitinophagales bacterium]